VNNAQVRAMKMKARPRKMFDWSDHSDITHEMFFRMLTCKKTLNCFNLTVLSTWCKYSSPVIPTTLPCTPLCPIFHFTLPNTRRFYRPVKRTVLGAGVALHSNFTLSNTRWFYSSRGYMPISLVNPLGLDTRYFYYF
jgi:hypothetical protein